MAFFPMIPIHMEHSQSIRAASEHFGTGPWQEASMPRLLNGHYMAVDWAALHMPERVNLETKS